MAPYLEIEMYYQRKLHDVFAGKSVAARARRAAFDVAAEADAEIASLQAQVDALARALERATHLNSFREFNDHIPTMRDALAKVGR